VMPTQVGDHRGLTIDLDRPKSGTPSPNKLCLYLAAQRRTHARFQPANSQRSPAWHNSSTSPSHRPVSSCAIRATSSLLTKAGAAASD
jgi:hypothetical protein